MRRVTGVMNQNILSVDVYLQRSSRDSFQAIQSPTQIIVEHLKVRKKTTLKFTTITTNTNASFLLNE